MWQHRPPRCKLSDLPRVQQENKSWFLSAEHETSVFLLRSLNAPGAAPGSLLTWRHLSPLWTPRHHAIWSLLLCISWDSPVFLSSSGWTWLPRVWRTSWRDWLPWKRGPRGPTWRKGNGLQTVFEPLHPGFKYLTSLKSANSSLIFMTIYRKNKDAINDVQNKNANSRVFRWRSSRYFLRSSYLFPITPSSQ